MVFVNNLSVTREKELVLDNLSFRLEPGTITTFIGKSGAGKTTLLKTLIGLIPKNKGTILINNKELSTLNPWQRAQEIGYVFQDFNLFPRFTVLENCTDPLIIQGIDPIQAQACAVNILQKLDMTDFVTKYPAELSGGQQQRVAIARALCLNPRVLLLDEPTASLDPINTDILIHLLKSLLKDGLTIALSSQDMNFVRKIFDRIYYIEKGKIIEYCESKKILQSCPIISKFISLTIEQLLKTTWDNEL